MESSVNPGIPYNNSLTDKLRIFPNDINTNISDYSVDDLINLLGINISDESDYDVVVDRINNHVDKYIKFFNSAGNIKIASFFEDIRKSLIGTKSSINLTEGEKLLDVYTDDKKDNGETTDNIRQITKLLTVDSRFRKHYNQTLSTNFIFHLPYVVNNVTEIVLADIEFPATFYPFQDEYENNYMWLKYEYISGGENKRKYCYIYLKPGNFYQESLISEIQSVFDSEGVPIVIEHNLDFNNAGGIGTGTGKISFSFTNSGDIEEVTKIELNFKGRKLTSGYRNYDTSHFISNPLEGSSLYKIIEDYYYTDSSIDYRTRLGWMMGFREIIYTGSTIYESEGQLDIIGPRYIYIILDDHNPSANINFFTNNPDSILDGDIIARVSVKAYAFSVQSQNDFQIYSEPRYYFGRVNIDRLRVKIVDEYNRVLNLNGMDFSFTLKMKVDSKY